VVVGGDGSVVGGGLAEGGLVGGGLVGGGLVVGAGLRGRGLAGTGAGEPDVGTVAPAGAVVVEDAGGAVTGTAADFAAWAKVPLGCTVNHTLATP
jgi:hypothetical protein